MSSKQDDSSVNITNTETDVLDPWIVVLIIIIACTVFLIIVIIVWMKIRRCWRQKLDQEMVLDDFNTTVQSRMMR